MKKTKIAINGFGRIGRLFLRALHESPRRDEFQVVFVNDLGDLKTNVHLFQYDSVHGSFNGSVKIDGDSFDIGSGPIKVTSIKNPAELPSKDIDIMIEASGVFVERDKAAAHLTAGAKRVLVTAPCKDADATIVYGVNHDVLKPEHLVVSNGSCTTNCLAPVAKVLHEAVGIQRGFMTTIHSYTGDQRLVDTVHKDLRRARAAAQSMIPSTTGAAKALGLVLPALKGKLDGTAIRVPTPNVSVVDLKFDAGRATTADEINNAMRKAASGALKGVLSVVEDELVSIDFNHNSSSSSFDATQTQVIDGTFVRVLSWYDNEWGFSNRLVDVASLMGKALSSNNAQAA